MNNLSDISMINILPPSLTKDSFVVALAEAIEIELKEAYCEAEKLSNLTDIENIPEVILDYIAYQKHVDFYDYTLPLEAKRKLIKDSTYLHRIKGTPKAIELLLDTVFGDGEVEEWFDYGSSPFKFRVLTRNASATQEMAEEFIRAVNTVKNKRSILESVIIVKTEQMNVYWGGFIHVGSYEQIGR